MNDYPEILRRVEELRAQDISREGIVKRARQGGWATQEQIKTVYAIEHHGWTLTPLEIEGLERDIKLTAKDNHISLLKRENKRLRLRADKVNRTVEFYHENVKPFEPVPYVPQKTTGHRQVLVALSSDEHIQALLTYERMHGINEYDKSLARRRMLYYAQRQIDYVNRYWSEKNITVIVDANLGDKFEGSIHDADLTNECSFAEGLAHYIEIKNQCYQMILRECPHVKIVSLHLSGNHTRRKAKPDVDRPLDTGDAAAALALATHYVNEPRVRFIVPDSYFQPLVINGHVFIFEHGHFIRSWAGIPYYGQDRRYKNFLSMLEKTAEYRALLVRALREPILRYGDDLTLDDIPEIQKHYVIGHFHVADKGRETSAGTVIMNGSVEGPSDFSLSIVAANAASQVMFAVHSTFGPTDSTSIQLGHIRHSRQLTPAEVLKPISITA